MKLRSLRLIAFSLVALFGVGTAQSAPSDQFVDVEPGAVPYASPAASPSHNPQERLDTVLLEERELQRELRATAGERSQLEKLIAARGRAYVRQVKVGLLPAAAGHRGLIEHASSVERLRRALARDLARDRELTERRLAVQRRLQLLAERRAPLEEAARLVAANAAAVESARERAVAFERAFLQASSADHTAVYGAGVDSTDLAQLARGFRGLKGRLPFPLTGRTEIEPGSLPGSSGSGLFMVATVGAKVRSVAKGSVAFADEYADYGRSVIIDHGDGFFSVTATLGSLDVRAGDELAGGERIGTVGVEGRLYFEVRLGTDTLDAKDWFGL